MVLPTLLPLPVGTKIVWPTALPAENNLNNGRHSYT
jgi:hypothetical protein